MSRTTRHSMMATRNATARTTTTQTLIPSTTTRAKSLCRSPDAVASTLRSAALAKGARFDNDDLVFWPVIPSPSLAVLIGDDALGDRDITNRVWAHIAEHDLQDPEDHSYVYFDEVLRLALNTDVDGLSAIAFSERLASHVIRPTSGVVTTPRVVG